MELYVDSDDDEKSLEKELDFKMMDREIEPLRKGKEFRCSPMRAFQRNLRKLQADEGYAEPSDHEEIFSKEDEVADKTYRW